MGQEHMLDAILRVERGEADDFLSRTQSSVHTTDAANFYLDRQMVAWTTGCRKADEVICRSKKSRALLDPLNAMDPSCKGVEWYTDQCFAS
jgi:hypothetical protein